MFIIKCLLQAEYVSRVERQQFLLRAFNKHSAPASRFPAPRSLISETRLNYFSMFEISPFCS